MYRYFITFRHVRKQKVNDGGTANVHLVIMALTAPVSAFSFDMCI